MIPQRSIPQVPIGQAIEAQNALISQFQDARKAAQSAPIQVVQGQGITPNQLMQYNLNNALQVSNRMDGTNQVLRDIDPAKDVRARERFVEGLEKENFAQNRQDSRTIYDTQQTFLNNKTIEGLRDQNVRNAQLDERNWKEKFRQQGRDYEDTKKRILQNDFGDMLAKPIRAYEQWHFGTGPGSRDAAMQKFEEQFIDIKARDPQIQAKFAQEGLNGEKFVNGTHEGYAEALREFVRNQMGSAAMASEFMVMFNQSVMREENSLRQLKDEALTTAMRMGVVPGGRPSQAGTTPPPQNSNSLQPNPQPTAQPTPSPQGTVPPPQGTAVPPPESTTQPNGLTATQTAELLGKFPDADENKDGQLTKEEIASFVDNPLVSEDTRRSAYDMARYTLGAGWLYNTLRSKETGTALAQSIMDQEIKALGPNVTPDADSLKDEQTRVKEKALKPTETDAKLVKRDSDFVKQDQETLKKVNGKVAEHQKKVKNITDMVEKHKKTMAKFTAKFGNPLSPLGSHNMTGEDKVKMEKLEKTLANYENNLLNAQKKLNKAKDAQAKARENLQGSKDALEKTKGRAERIANNPNRAQIRSKIPLEESKANMTHNTQMRTIGTKYGIPESEIKLMLDEDGRISASAIRDRMAKQELGNVSHRVKRIMTAIKANPAGLAKTTGKLIGGVGLIAGPELYDIASSIFDSKAERDQAIKEFEEMIADFQEINRLAEDEIKMSTNPLTVDQNQSVGQFFDSP